MYRLLLLVILDADHTILRTARILARGPSRVLIEEFDKQTKQVSWLLLASH
jgi:hypothetical protein